MFDRVLVLLTVSAHLLETESHRRLNPVSAGSLETGVSPANQQTQCKFASLLFSRS